MTPVKEPKVVALREERYLPTIAVPSRRTRVTLHGRCRHCGGTALDVECPTSEGGGRYRPHVAHVATVRCLLCGRDLALLRLGGEP